LAARQASIVGRVGGCISRIRSGRTPTSAGPVRPTRRARRGVVPDSSSTWIPRASKTTTRRADIKRSSVRAAASSSAPALAADDPEATRETGYRFVVVALIALALLLCNADRVIMSVAGVPLAQAHGWGERAIGLVQSSFLWGYMLTPLLGGVLADRYGGKAVLGGGILVWSLATMATPFAAATSLPLLLLTRAVMGLGEGVALPCMNNLTARWVPKAERSRAVAACMGGFQSGSMVGLLAAPAMLAWGGVTGPFAVFGLSGVLWAVVWGFAATTYPRESLASRRVSPAELAHIEDGGSVADDSATMKSERPPFRLLLSKAPVWACIVANFVNNWGYFILLAWMPLYFKQVMGLELAKSSYFSALPWATMALSGVFAGTLADSLIAKGVSVTTVRKFIQGVGFIGPALMLVLLTFQTSANGALAVLTVAIGCTAFTQAGFLVNFQEIGPRYVGALHGMANTAGSFAGIVGTYMTGVILESTGSWRAVLFITAGVYAFGAATWLAFSTGEKVFD
jgi:MFS transporter, ACS family, solute carrier family 17 (sodium-dependent inorganic phosphate cotransporter), other